MSVLLLTTAGLGALWLKSTNRPKKRVAEKRPRHETAYAYLHSGTYGDTGDISSTLHQRGFIVDEEIGLDLSGVPCRWLRARNNAVYKTYDMNTQFVH